jgi:hypothetical protein
MNNAFRMRSGVLPTRRWLTTMRARAERQALADDLNDAWPPDVSTTALQAQARFMGPELRDAPRSEGIPDDEVFAAASALADLVRFGESA